MPLDKEAQAWYEEAKRRGIIDKDADAKAWASEAKRRGIIRDSDSGQGDVRSYERNNGKSLVPQKASWARENVTYQPKTTIGPDKPAGRVDRRESTGGGGGRSKPSTTKNPLPAIQNWSDLDIATWKAMNAVPSAVLGTIGAGVGSVLGLPGAIVGGAGGGMGGGLVTEPANSILGGDQNRVIAQRSARFAKEHPWLDVLAENLPQLAFNNPLKLSTEVAGKIAAMKAAGAGKAAVALARTDVPGRLITGAIGAGTDVGLKVAQGQKQDAEQTARAFAAGALTHGANTKLGSGFENVFKIQRPARQQKSPRLSVPPTPFVEPHTSDTVTPPADPVSQYQQGKAIIDAEHAAAVAAHADAASKIPKDPKLIASAYERTKLSRVKAEAALRTAKTPQTATRAKLALDAIDSQLAQYDAILRGEFPGPAPQHPGYDSLGPDPAAFGGPVEQAPVSDGSEFNMRTPEPPAANGLPAPKPVLGLPAPPPRTATMAGGEPSGAVHHKNPELLAIEKRIRNVGWDMLFPGEKARYEELKREDDASRGLGKPKPDNILGEQAPSNYLTAPDPLPEPPKAAPRPTSAETGESILSNIDARTRSSDAFESLVNSHEGTSPRVLQGMVDDFSKKIALEQSRPKSMRDQEHIDELTARRNVAVEALKRANAAKEAPKSSPVKPVQSQTPEPKPTQAAAKSPKPGKASQQAPPVEAEAPKQESIPVPPPPLSEQRGTAKPKQAEPPKTTPKKADQGEHFDTFDPTAEKKARAAEEKAKRDAAKKSDEDFADAQVAKAVEAQKADEPTGDHEALASSLGTQTIQTSSGESRIGPRSSPAKLRKTLEAWVKARFKALVGDGTGIDDLTPDEAAKHIKRVLNGDDYEDMGDEQAFKAASALDSQDTAMRYPGDENVGEVDVDALVKGASETPKPGVKTPEPPPNPTPPPVEKPGASVKPHTSDSKVPDSFETTNGDGETVEIQGGLPRTKESASKLVERVENLQESLGEDPRLEDVLDAVDDLTDHMDSRPIRSDYERGTEGAEEHRGDLEQWKSDLEEKRVALRDELDTLIRSLYEPPKPVGPHTSDGKTPAEIQADLIEAIARVKKDPSPENAAEVTRLRDALIEADENAPKPRDPNDVSTTPATPESPHIRKNADGSFSFLPRKNGSPIPLTDEAVARIKSQLDGIPEKHHDEAAVAFARSFLDYQYNTGGDQLKGGSLAYVPSSAWDGSRTDHPTRWAIVVVEPRGKIGDGFDQTVIRVSQPEWLKEQLAGLGHPNPPEGVGENGIWKVPTAGRGEPSLLIPFDSGLSGHTNAITQRKLGYTRRLNAPSTPAPRPWQTLVVDHSSLKDKSKFVQVNLNRIMQVNGRNGETKQVPVRFHIGATGVIKLALKVKGGMGEAASVRFKVTGVVEGNKAQGRGVSIVSTEDVVFTNKGGRTKNKSQVGVLPQGTEFFVWEKASPELGEIGFDSVSQIRTSVENPKPGAEPMRTINMDETMLRVGKIGENADIVKTDKASEIAALKTHEERVAADDSFILTRLREAADSVKKSEGCP